MDANQVSRTQVQYEQMDSHTIMDECSFMPRRCRTTASDDSKPDPSKPSPSPQWYSKD